MSVGSHLNTFSLALFVVAYAQLVIFALAMYPVHSGAAILPLVDDPQFLYGQPDARACGIADARTGSSTCPWAMEACC